MYRAVVPLPRLLGQLNRRVVNRFTGPIAARAPWLAEVVHIGRKSGRTYRTPVLAFRTGDRCHIPLTYGRDTDWLKNVVAADGCSLVIGGRPVTARTPEVTHDPGASWAPFVVRQGLRVIDAPYVLTLAVG